MRFLVTSVVLVCPLYYTCLLPGRNGYVMDFAFWNTDTLCSFTLFKNAYNDAEQEWQGRAYH